MSDMEDVLELSSDLIAELEDTVKGDCTSDEDGSLPSIHDGSTVDSCDDSSTCASDDDDSSTCASDDDDSDFDDLPLSPRKTMLFAQPSQGSRAMSPVSFLSPIRRQVQSPAPDSMQKEQDTSRYSIAPSPYAGTSSEDNFGVVDLVSNEDDGKTAETTYEDWWQNVPKSLLVLVTQPNTERVWRVINLAQEQGDIKATTGNSTSELCQITFRLRANESNNQEQELQFPAGSNLWTVVVPTDFANKEDKTQAIKLITDIKDKLRVQCGQLVHHNHFVGLCRHQNGSGNAKVEIGPGRITCRYQ